MFGTYIWYMYLVHSNFTKFSVHVACGRYSDSVDNTVEENSSIFSLIQMHWMPSARACGQ